MTNTHRKGYKSNVDTLGNILFQKRENIEDGYVS